MPKEKESTKEVIKFDVETAVIVALDKKYKDVQITDGKSYALVMAGIGEYRELRLAVVDGHKEEKKEALDHCNFLDAEKRRILARLAPGEEHLKGIRQAYDDEKDRIKAEKEAKEKARVDNIRAKIIQITIMQSGLHTMSLIELRGLSDELEKIDVRDGFHEFTDEAEKVLDATYNAVQEAIAVRIKLDKEEAERKAEDERLEKVKKKQEAEQTKREQLDKAFEDQKEWFKKHIKGDSFQTPNVDELEKAIPALETITNHEVHEPAMKLLLDEQVEEAHGILKFRKDQAKLTEAQKKLEADKKAEEDRKNQEAFEKEATEKAEAAAAQKLKDAALKKEEEEKTAEVEKARKEAARPDREKLISFVGELMSITGPLDLTDKSAIGILDDMIPKIREIALDIKRKAQEL